MAGRRGTGGDLADRGQPDWPALKDLTERVTGPGLQAKASVSLVLGKAGRWLDRQASAHDLKRQLTNQPFPVEQIPLTAGAGVLNIPDLYGPHDGYTWDVRYIVADSFTAGTVSIYNTYQSDGNLEGVFTSAGLIRWGGDLILNDTEQLIFVAAGITGAVTISGRFNNVPAPLLPDYLL
jgi:hypothetical protein